MTTSLFPPEAVEHHKSKCALCEGTQKVIVYRLHWKKPRKDMEPLSCVAVIESEDPSVLPVFGEDETDVHVISGAKPCPRCSTAEQQPRIPASAALPDQHGSEGAGRTNLSSDPLGDEPPRRRKSRYFYPPGEVVSDRKSEAAGDRE